MVLSAPLRQTVDPTRRVQPGARNRAAKVVWRDGWLWLDDETSSAAPNHPANSPSRCVPAPDLPAHPFRNEPETDDFDGGTLDIHWQSLRVPVEESWLSLKERDGFLRLYGRESLASRFNQSLIGRRLQAHHAEAETCLEFDPDYFQQMSGLVAYYQTENWVYLRVSRDGWLGKTLNILSYENSHYDEPLDAEVPIGDAERVYLKVVFGGGNLPLRICFGR